MCQKFGRKPLTIWYSKQNFKLFNIQIFIPFSNCLQCKNRYIKLRNIWLETNGVLLFYRQLNLSPTKAAGIVNIRAHADEYPSQRNNCYVIQKKILQQSYYYI